MLLREGLTEKRRSGITFERAWAEAITENPVWPEWQGCTDFMLKHFRAAYNRDESTRARFRVPPTDTSAPVVRSPLSRPVRGPARCQWAEGCGEVATRGRFGPTFCDKHGAILEALWMVPGEDSHGCLGLAA